MIERQLNIIGVVVSLLGVAAVTIVQVCAIVTVHWYHGWFYFKSGVEYNTVLLALLLTVTITTVASARAVWR